MILQIIILPLLVTQVLSAPSGCIESCNSFVKSYRTQTSGNIENHGDLTQSATNLQGLNYARPGTWTEHNDYNVDNGHGKVHEERGQVVEGPKTVRYYKKNYTSSYSTGYSNGADLSELGHQNNNYNRGVHPSDSQRTYNQIGTSESIAQRQRYNTIQDQQHMQSSIRRTNSQSERLEDFGEYSGNSQTVQGISDLNTQFSPEVYPASTSSGNWSRVDSHKTDGGRGRVFEEEGQYVSGPKKVRYYKRNYTSGYTSTNGFPVPEATVTGMHDLHKEMEKIHRELGKEFNQISTAGNIASSNIAQTNTNTYGLSSDNLPSLNGNTYRNHVHHRSQYHRNEEQYRADTASEYVPHTSPLQNTYGSNSYSMYERHEGRVPTGQFITPTSGYTNVLTTGNSGYSSSVHGGRFTQGTHNLDQTELLDRYQSQDVQSQMDNDNLNRHIYNQNSGIHSGTPGRGTPGRATHYREHWHSDHTRETSVPQHSQDISEINEQSARYNTHQYGNQHSAQQTIQDSSSMQQYGQNSYNSEHQRRLDKLTTGTLDLGQGHDTVDCAYGTEEHTHHSSSRYQRRYKRSINQDKLSHMQQHSDPGDFTQQTSGNLQFGQESQYSYDPWEQHASNQQLKDLTQETEDLDDLTQQTSGKLEFGQQTQHSYQPQKPGTNGQHLEDLTQQTGDFDDFTQQTSGKLEFGNQLRPQSQKPGTNGQHLEDLTQQTGDFDDLTQQTSGKLQFGNQQQSQQPQSHNQYSEDLTQQTGNFDDLTQQTSGKLELGQQSQHTHQPQKPRTGNQDLEDLTQQTGEFDDLTQQTSGKLEFGSQLQQQPQKPQSQNQYSEDLTQQTGDFDDLTQQTSGKLEFGQQSQHTYQPQKPRTGSQHLEDLTQQTGEFDDLTQQTSGNLEFGSQSQHSHKPQRPGSRDQHSEDMTQQTGGFDDLTQQTSGKLEFGSQLQQQSHNQYSEDLTQQTGDFDDLTQQTSGKLEFGQQTQYPYQPQTPGSSNQHMDLTQQTGEFDDLTQQTSGKLEFGQQTQHYNQPQKPRTSNQHLEDLTQQTGEFDDLTQQTSGKLEFGSQSRYPYQTQRPRSYNQYSEHTTQQTGNLEDLTQQTSGNLEFGQQTQYPYQFQKPGSNNQHLDDLTQQSGGFDDLTQQTSGGLEFGHHSYQPRKPGTGNQYSEDLTQQTGEFDDLTQQTSGKIEFNQQSQNSYHPQESSNQYADDLTQQTSGKINFGQLGQQHNEDFTTQQHGSTMQLPKPAEKPKPRARYSRRGSLNNLHTQDSSIANTVNQENSHNGVGDVSIQNNQKLPPKVLPESEIGNVRRENIRGDQGSESTTGKYVSKNLNEDLEDFGLAIEGGHEDQNRLHKSNDATVGMQWHYTYHPSDRRHFVQQTDQKQKDDLQQQSRQLDPSGLHLDEQHALEDLYQSSNRYNEKSEIDQQSQKHGYAQETEFGQKTSDIQKQDQLNQQTTDETQDQLVQNTEIKQILEPRILEAYGGGPYDASHSDDIYNGVTINPSATLPPINGADPWDIREKPSEMNIMPYEVTPPPMPVEPLTTETEETTPSPSFWSRVGNKITNTFGKAKEKARTIFG